MTLTLSAKTWARWARMERAPHRAPSDRAIEWLVANYGGTRHRWAWTVESAVSKGTLEARRVLRWSLKEALTSPPSATGQRRKVLPKVMPLPPTRRVVEDKPERSAAAIRADLARQRAKADAEDTATAEREAALTRTVRQLQADVDRLTRENARLRVAVQSLRASLECRAGLE